MMSMDSMLAQLAMPVIVEASYRSQRSQRSRRSNMHDEPEDERHAVYKDFIRDALDVHFADYLVSRILVQRVGDGLNVDWVAGYATVHTMNVLPSDDSIEVFEIVRSPTIRGGRVIVNPGRRESIGVVHLCDPRSLSLLGEMFYQSYCRLPRKPVETDDED
jgi:hypothetical protein